MVKSSTGWDRMMMTRGFSMCTVYGFIRSMDGKNKKQASKVCTAIISNQLHSA
jgi:hypothetical protein